MLLYWSACACHNTSQAGGHHLLILLCNILRAITTSFHQYYGLAVQFGWSISICVLKGRVTPYQPFLHMVLKTPNPNLTQTYIYEFWKIAKGIS